jgi:hypothetical protein
MPNSMTSDPLNICIPQSKPLAVEHVAPETRPSYWSNNSLQGLHCFVFEYSHGLVVSTCANTSHHRHKTSQISDKMDIVD